MKTMISMDKKLIKRVTDEKATELYHDGWIYVSKSLWKEKVRDIEKPKEGIIEAYRTSKLSINQTIGLKTSSRALNT